MEDAIEGMKKKLRTVKSKEQRLQTQGENKEDYIAKLEEELTKLKDAYNTAVEITNFSEDREERQANRFKIHSSSRNLHETSRQKKTIQIKKPTSSWRTHIDDEKD